MTLKIKQYDRQIQELGEAKYPETQALLKVHGVGHLTALTFVLTLGSKERFRQSRDFGCDLGLRPRRILSGDRDPQLGITEAGNVYLRSLLIECSNHILRPHGRDSRCDSGVCTWPPEVASRPRARPLLQWPASWPCCFITSGARKKLTRRSTNKQPERSTCLPVATTPCSDDCEPTSAFEADR